MNRNIKPNEKSPMSIFSKQLSICTAVLIILSLLKISPDDVFVNAKSAVSLILTHHTDIKEEGKKIKKIFVQDNSILAMNPVSELANPVKNAIIVKGFGVQDADESGFHYGVDLKVESGENICAVSTGIVTEIATNQEYGSYILIKHNDEISTLYAHLNEIFPDIGATVETNQAIARANPENNTIHFEIKKGDTYLDPLEFIDFGENND